MVVNIVLLNRNNMYNKMTRVIKTLKQKYWTPTPKKWRKIGDAFLAVSSVLAIGGLWQFDNLKDIFTAFEIKAMIVTSVSLGAIGKFLTNFFIEDDTETRK
jgi:hypothetical protein